MSPRHYRRREEVDDSSVPIGTEAWTHADYRGRVQGGNDLAFSLSATVRLAWRPRAMARSRQRQGYRFDSCTAGRRDDVGERQCKSALVVTRLSYRRPGGEVSSLIHERALLTSKHRWRESAVSMSLSAVANEVIPASVDRIIAGRERCGCYADSSSRCWERE